MRGDKTAEERADDAATTHDEYRTAEDLSLGDVYDERGGGGKEEKEKIESLGGELRGIFHERQINDEKPSAPHAHPREQGNGKGGDDGLHDVFSFPNSE